MIYSLVNNFPELFMTKKNIEMEEGELEVIYEYQYEYDIYEPEPEKIEYAIRPNKTKIKKEIAEMLALGEEMAKLTPTQLTYIGLPEKLHNAILEVAPMKHDGARKRLLKFIAGQLHKIDANPFIEKLAKFQNKSAHATREHHIAEKWRDRLLDDQQDGLTDLLDEHPNADRQHLRQLIRNAQKEVVKNQPPKSSRLLYRYLKTLFLQENEAEEQDFVVDETEENEK